MIPNVHKGGLHISFPFLASPFFPSSNLSDHRFVDVIELTESILGIEF